MKEKERKTRTEGRIRTRTRTRLNEDGMRVLEYLSQVLIKTIL